MKLQQDEEIIHEMRPAGAILVIWFFPKCLFPTLPVGFASLFAFGGLAAGFGGPGEWESFGVAALVAVAVPSTAFLLLMFYCRCLRRTYMYYITNQRCVFRGGILRRIERSVPYHKVTDVETSQNIVERALGISTLNIFTPGTGSMTATPFGGQRAEISFVGLTDSETPAATINEILRRFRATGAGSVLWERDHPPGSSAATGTTSTPPPMAPAWRLPRNSALST
jgi:uncharacterized membrane protein YdbT with pleckstrin-like domain